MALPVRLHRIDGARYAVPWSVFPLTPDPLRRPLTLGSTRLLMRSLQAVGFGRPDLMLVDQPLLEYLIRPIDPHRVIYRPTDINLDPLTRAAEDRIMRLASGVVATSGVVAGQLAARHPGQHFDVVENGVQTRHFIDAKRAWADRRGVVYVGALDSRFDWPTVIALAGTVPTERFDIFGPAATGHPELPANVRLSGSVDYADLPAVLSRYRVGLLPLNDDPTNSGRSPMKLYEYLAAGLNVVSRATAVTTAGPIGDAYCYQDADSANAVLAHALTSEPTGHGARAAAAMDWSARARLLLAASMVAPRSSHSLVGRPTSSIDQSAAPDPR
jgi:teichuronic acid biosynthesis glycosyltransferase TuaH